MVALGVVAVSVVGIYYLASSVIPRALITATKASVGVTVSLADSYVIGEKILARADGEDKCRVNVFLMDREGRAVPGKEVEMTGMEGIVTEKAISDTNGKVSFEMSSNKEGQYDLKAMVGGAEMSRGVTVTFRN